MKTILTTVLILFAAGLCAPCVLSPRGVVRLGLDSAGQRRQAGASLLPPGSYGDDADHELGYIAPRPSARDAAIEELCRRYAQSDEAQRARMRNSLSDRETWGLDVFAGRAAVFALRERSVERLAAGLTALSMIDEQRRDWRERPAMPLCLLRHSAARLGADHRALFRDAARLAGPETSEAIVRFLTATPQGKTFCTDCGYSEVETEAGVGFIYCESKPYNPTYKLEHVAIDISRLAASRGLTAIRTLIGSELEPDWLRGVDDEALNRALGRARAGVEVIPLLRRGKDSEPEPAGLFGVYVVELADQESARALLDLARRKKSSDRVFVGLAERRLFCLVVADSSALSGERFEAAGGMPSFSREVAEILRRHARS